MQKIHVFLKLHIVKVKNRQHFLCLVYDSYKTFGALYISVLAFSKSFYGFDFHQLSIRECIDSIHGKRIALIFKCLDFFFRFQFTFAHLSRFLFSFRLNQMHSFWRPHLLLLDIFKERLNLINSISIWNLFILRFQSSIPDHKRKQSKLTPDTSVVCGRHISFSFPNSS